MASSGKFCQDASRLLAHWKARQRFGVRPSSGALAHRWTRASETPRSEPVTASRRNLTGNSGSGRWDGRAGRGCLPHPGDLRRGQAVPAAAFQHLAFSLQPCAPGSGFRRRGRGRVRGCGCICLATGEGRRNSLVNGPTYGLTRFPRAKISPWHGLSTRQKPKSCPEGAYAPLRIRTPLKRPEPIRFARPPS